MKHYVYELTTQPTGGPKLTYIGARSCQCEPELDHNYWSSSALVDHMRISGIQFEKRILDQYPSRAEAFAAEQVFLTELQAATDLCYINLNSNSQPYCAGRAGQKLQYFKQLFPDLVPHYQARIAHSLAHWEQQYCVQESAWICKFVEHPGKLKFYWPTTGTRTFWPGRPDGLMTQRGAVETRYQTDFSSLDGTALERIHSLYASHYVQGQRTPVLEFVEELMLLLTPKEWTEARNLIQQHSADKTWILNRIDRSHKKKLQQQTRKHSGPKDT